MIPTEENHGPSAQGGTHMLPPIYNYGSLNLFTPHSTQVNYYVGSDATLEQLQLLQETVPASTSFSEEEVQQADALLPYMDHPKAALPYLRRIRNCRTSRQFTNVVLDMYVGICRTKFNRDHVFRDTEFIEVLLSFVPEVYKNAPNSGFTKANVARQVVAKFKDPEVEKELEEQKLQRKRAEKNAWPDDPAEDAPERR